MKLGVHPRRQAKGEPHKHPNEPDQLEEYIGLPVPQAWRDSNERIFECDAHCLEEEKLYGPHFRELQFGGDVLWDGVDYPRDKKCCEKFEVGHKHPSWEMEGVRNEICVACEEPTEHLMPDTTVRFCEEERKKAEPFGTYPQHFRSV